MVPFVEQAAADDLPEVLDVRVPSSVGCQAGPVAEVLELAGVLDVLLHDAIGAATKLAAVMRLATPAVLDPAELLLLLTAVADVPPASDSTHFDCWVNVLRKKKTKELRYCMIEMGKTDGAGGKYACVGRRALAPL